MWVKAKYSYRKLACYFDNDAPNILSDNFCYIYFKYHWFETQRKVYYICG